MTNLQDEVALVVGAAQGIGLAIAAELSGRAARVALADIRSTVIATAKTWPKADHGQAAGFELDATQLHQVQRCVAEVLDTWGRIDHVVYAAGCGSGKYGFPFWNLQPSDWQRVLEVNLIGAVNTLHACQPTLTDRRHGSVVMIASVAGQIGSQTDPPYSAAKAALINFAQCAAKDLAPYDVRVNTICPGMIKTAVNRSVWQAWYDQQPEAERLTYEQWGDAKVRAVSALGRWQHPEDVAALAAFLTSSQARNITGQTLNVDGGQVMR